MSNQPIDQLTAGEEYWYVRYREAVRKCDEAVGLLRDIRNNTSEPWITTRIDTLLSQLEAENDEGAKRE